MTRRRAFWTALAFAHLALVALGAAALYPSVLRTYGALSGADNGYGFFAPGVAAQIRGTFTLTDDAGRTWTDVLERGTNAEADLRLGSVVSLITVHEDDPSWRRGLGSSWAATMFGRHPEARRVEIRVEIHDLPTMTEYRAGERPGWTTIYEATFDR